jgi:hypothetical protein
MHQTVFHGHFQFGAQMDPINKELFEKDLGNVSFFNKQSAVNPRKLIDCGKGLSVSLVTGSKYKIKILSLVIDDEIQPKSEEPSDAALARCCQSLQYLMGMLYHNAASS